MSSTEPAPEVAFYRRQRAALVAALPGLDPGRGRTSTAWAAPTATTCEHWPRPAREARAFVAG